MARLAKESGVVTHPGNLRKKLEDVPDGSPRPNPVALDPIEVDQLADALGVSVPPRVFHADLLAGRIARCRSANAARKGGSS